MRKELQLDEENTIFWLQKAADKKKWSLKKYMEQVLISDAEKIKHRTILSSNNPHKIQKTLVDK